MKRISIYFLVLAMVIAACTSTKKVANAQHTVKDKLYKEVNFLASDSLKGRFPGSPESTVAANYLRTQLQSYGYKPLADGGFQTFDLVMSQKLGDNNKLAVNGVEAKAGRDFTTLSISGSGEASAKPCFVGYGLVVDEKGLERDDYQGMDVSGRWVVLLLGVPSKDYEAYSRYQSKAIIAKERGAAGVLFVAEPTTDSASELMPFVMREASVGLPCMQISRKLADELLRDKNTNLATVEKNLANTKNSISYELDATVVASTEIKSVKATTCNVVMVMEGNDPLLKGESVVIGAHYDHLGFGGQGSGSRRPSEHAVHNGADDNASGVALVLQLAERLAKQKKQLKRNLVVVLFGAEEQGIVGSKYFVANQPKGVGKIVTMMNFDMVGRLNSERTIQVSGIGTFAQAEVLVKQAHNPDSLKLTLSKGGFGPSDHAAFYGKQIPVLYFTTGVHLDYHTPADDADKINYDGMLSLCTLADDIAVKLASMPAAPEYQNAGDSENTSPMRSFKVTLGIIPDFTSSGSDGMRADVVSEGRPAYNAGMKNGDVIVGINGKAVSNIQDYMVRLSELKKGDVAEVEVKRGDARLTLYVEL